MTDLNELQPEEAHLPSSVTESSFDHTPAPHIYGSPNQPSTSARSVSPFVFLVGGLGVGVCVCIGLFVAILGVNMAQTAMDQEPIKHTMDLYMQHMVRKETDEAYALFSDFAQQHFQKEELQALVDGDNYVLFEGYQRLTVTKWEVKAQAGQGLPAGTIVITDGIVHYDGGIEGSFNATLQKNEGQWQLIGIYINVPISKVSQK